MSAATRVLGKDLIISAGSSVLAGQTEGELQLEGDAIETTAKGDFPNREYKPGFGGWKLTCGGMVELEDGGFTAVQAAQLNRTTLSVSCDINGTTYTGTGIPTRVSISGPTKDAAKLTLELQGTGVLTPAGS